MPCVERLAGGAILVTGAGIPLLSLLSVRSMCQLETELPTQLHRWRAHRLMAKRFGIAGRMTPTVRAQVRERIAQEIDKAQNAVNSADFEEMLVKSAGRN
jgi:hypothetical protein